MPGRILSKPSALILALSIIACSGDSAKPPPSTAWDSAGITVVENSASLWQEAEGWRLADEPTVDIGVLEGESAYQLHQVMGALRLSDGRIVIANAGTEELRYYDASGVYLSASGRKGKGPGEFENLSRPRLFSGDSLLTWDWGNRRVSVFDPSGRFVRSFRLEAPGGASSMPDLLGAFPNRTLLANEGRVFRPGDAAGVQRDSVRYLVHDMEGALVDTLGRFPGPEFFVVASDDAITVTSRAFARNPQMAPHDAGLYLGSNDSYEIGHYSLSGKLDRLVRKAQPNLPVTPEDERLYIERRLESISNEAWRHQTEQMLADMPFPETMPAYSFMIVDAEENLWVLDFRRPGDEQPRWTVFDPQGVMLGIVETPPTLLVYQIGADFVIGRWRDDFDVEHVRLFELIKD
jgi:hypothetical protein